MKKITSCLLLFFTIFAIPTRADDKIVLNFKEEKIGLALASGGLLGAYELGALQYLREQGIEVTDFGSAIGTSVGAIILGSTLSNGLDETINLFMNIKNENIYNGKLSNSKCDFINYIMDRIYIRKGNIGNLALMTRGLLGGQSDTTPLREMIKSRVDENKILNSGVEVGFCTTPISNLLNTQCKYGEELNGKIADWIIASSSCYPVFKTYEVDGVKYMDGGYINSANADFLFDTFKCDKVVILDLMSYGKKCERDGVVSIVPTTDLGSFLDTTPSQIKSNYNQGYMDCKEYFEANVIIIK